MGRIPKKAYDKMRNPCAEAYQDEQKKKELLKAVESSNKSYEEILAFLKAE